MSLFRLSVGLQPPNTRNLPTSDGERLYVFGDVHGRHDLVLSLFHSIAHDLAQSPTTNATVVGLGDYIDRGSASGNVIDALITGVPGCRSVWIRGNHEQMLLDFLENPARIGPQWLAVGAAATLRSYDVDLSKSANPTATELRRLRDQLAYRMPTTHLLLLQQMPLMHQAGDFLFVHAGVARNRPLTHQRARDLLCSRTFSLSTDQPFEKVVVHGHTPIPEPFLGRYRINLDTGAFYSGRLTCLVLEGNDRRMLPSNASGTSSRPFLKGNPVNKL